jgi:hypothetical protein
MEGPLLLKLPKGLGVLLKNILKSKAFCDIYFGFYLENKGFALKI